MASSAGKADACDCRDRLSLPFASPDGRDRAQHVESDTRRHLLLWLSRRTMLLVEEEVWLSV